MIKLQFNSYKKYHPYHFFSYALECNDTNLVGKNTKLKIN